MKDTPQNQHNQPHKPVLLKAVIDNLDPKAGERYLDLTAGYGGHAQEILGRTLCLDKAYLVDRDQNAIDHLRQRFARQGVNILHADFLSAAQELRTAGEQFDLILADLGVSSPHLNNSERGFSFRGDGPLDMRMDQRQTLTAAKVVNDLSEKQIADILWHFGEERQSRKIARAIVMARPIRSTTALAEVIAKQLPRDHRMRHPATKTFQALRIFVNDELSLLEQALPIWIDLLAPGGRIAIISFHSLEDRLVKQILTEYSGNRYDATLQVLTKQPIRPSSREIVINPRARSAKLRAAVKIKITERGAVHAYTGKESLPCVQG